MFVRPEIAEMKGYVPGEQPRNSDIIKLNTNENPYPPSDSVIQAIQKAAGTLTRYPDATAAAFREVAADVLGVEPDWILCGNGSDDILTIVTRAMVGQGQLLRLPFPSYVLYKTLAQIQGAKSEEIHFDANWNLTEEFARPHPDLRVVYLPNPNSPSGTTISKARIVSLAESLPCPLLVDEAYVDFAEENCIDLVAQHEKIMVSRTLSKSYGLAGLRFGFLVAQPHIIGQLLKVKDSYNCDALSIAGATAALADQHWLVTNRNRILKTRSRLEQGMRKLGFSVQPSQANFVWCTHPNESDKRVYEHLKQHGIFVRYMNYEGWGDGIRISVGTDDQIGRCLAMIKQSLSIEANG